MARVPSSKRRCDRADCSRRNSFGGGFPSPLFRGSFVFGSYTRSSASLHSGLYSGAPFGCYPDSSGTHVCLQRRRRDGIQPGVERSETPGTTSARFSNPCQGVTGTAARCRIHRNERTGSTAVFLAPGARPTGSPLSCSPSKSRCSTRSRSGFREPARLHRPVRDDPRDPALRNLAHL